MKLLEAIAEGFRRFRAALGEGRGARLGSAPERPPITSSLFYDDPVSALDWLARTFGFQRGALVESPDGAVLRAELWLGGGLVTVAPTGGFTDRSSPRALRGANTQCLHVVVDDLDAHFARARAAGAALSEPATHRDGERSYAAQDCEGHRWVFAERRASPPDGGGAIDEP